MKTLKRRTFWQVLLRFAGFFLLVAFVDSCSFFLFLKALQGTINHDFTEAEISFAATITFYNVVVIALIITAVDFLLYFVKTMLPMKRILAFTDTLSKGDFSKRIAERKGVFRSEYDIIIHNLNLLASELGSIESLRNDFINNISHEIKTPLSVIQNYTQLMMVSEGKNEEYLKAIYTSTERLNGLVKDILRLSRLEKQEIFPERKTFSLSDSLADCIIAFEDKWEAKHINLEADIEEDVSINADKDLLAIIWNNLLSNAIKFTPEKGSILVSLKKESGRAVVKVIDSGCGINKADIKHIFDKFYQGESEHKREGNGLGLALVKRVAIIEGADLEVSSEEGKGSVFSVSFLINP